MEECLGLTLPAAMREFYALEGLWSVRSVLGTLTASLDPLGFEFGHPHPDDFLVEFNDPPDRQWRALCDPPAEDPPVISLSHNLSCTTFSEFVLATWVANTVFTWPHRGAVQSFGWPAEATSPELGFGECSLSTQPLGGVMLGEGPDILMAHTVGVQELTIVARTPEAFAGLPAGLRSRFRRINIG